MKEYTPEQQKRIVEIASAPSKVCANVVSRFDVRDVREEAIRAALSDPLLRQPIADEAIERCAKVCEGLPQKNHIQPAGRRSRMANLCAAALLALIKPKGNS